jgi:hypothetical protein
MPMEGKSFPFISRKAVPAKILVLEIAEQILDHHSSRLRHLKVMERCSEVRAHLDCHHFL